jgi:RsiW-degrading membrane proteinase PrsW (M82 family)
LQSKPVNHYKSDLLLGVLCCAGILGLLIRSGTMLVTGILSIDQGNDVSLAANMLGALGMLFCACMLIPSLVYTIRRLKGQEYPQATLLPVKLWQVLALVAAWVGVVISDALLSNLFDYGWAVSAPLFLLGIFLPLFTLVWICIGGLPGGTRRRLWSVFGYGVVGGPLIAVLLEYLVVGIAALALLALAVGNPELRTVIEQIKNQLTTANTGDMQALLTILAPYLTNPIVILSIFIFAAVLTPLIEEAVKPAIIWVLGKRLLHPAEGFVLGALCGAGFALLEGLMAASNASQMAGFSLAGRAAASLMHIAGSGFMGWAIASAQLEKRYGRLVMTYLLSVSIHGLWNGSAIMAVYGSLRVMIQNTQTDLPGLFFTLGGIGMLIFELVVLLIALPLINQSLRRSVIPIPVPSQSDIIPPLTTSFTRDTDGSDS